MFNWSTYLLVAENLVHCDPGDEKAEGSWRSGVSRAYYCAYHTVREYVLTQEGWSPPVKEDSHWSLIRYVREIRVHSKLHLKIAKELAELRVARTQADYDAGPPVSQGKAIAAVSDARVILGLVDDLRKRRASPPSGPGGNRAT